MQITTHHWLVCSAFCLMLACKSSEEAPLTPSEKAASAVQHYLSGNAMACAQYESVSFGQADSFFSVPDFDSANALISLASVYADKATEALMISAKISSAYSDTSIQYSQQARALIDNFKPAFVGWKINHAYRCTEAGGVVSGRNAIFLLDTAYQVLEMVQ